MAFLGRLSDRTLATLLGALLALVGGWPLFFVRTAPYQDLPDHLATVAVLLDPAKYPEFVSNGWFKANSAIVAILYLLAKGIGLLAAGHLLPILVVTATAFALPHFVLTFTDRRRMLVASLFLAPMVHHWWTVMGMLNFSLGFALSLVVLGMLRRQSEEPSLGRGFAIAALTVPLWFAHGLVLLLVGLLATIEAVYRVGREPLEATVSRARALLVPLIPMGAVTLGTAFNHHQFGHVDMVKFEPTIESLYDLWAHWFLDLSFLSAAGLINALALLYFAIRAARDRTPLFSIWALVVVGAFYLFVPLTIPGVGYFSERALPFLWMWALVRVPENLPRWTSRLLVASSAAWSIGLGADLFRGATDLDDFSAAAPLVPDGARLLNLNFDSRGRATNTFSLVHASGMYTVLRGAHPLDVWADSTSMPIMRRHAPSVFVEDPVRVREFIGLARDAKHYCARMDQTGFSDIDCAVRWREAWDEFWRESAKKYDYVILWGTPEGVRGTVPEGFVSEMKRGKLELLVRPAGAGAHVLTSN